MKSKEKLLNSLTDKISLLCEEQKNRQIVAYDMFTKLENRIRSLENQIRILESKIDQIPVRRDCSICVIS